MQIKPAVQRCFCILQPREMNLLVSSVNLHHCKKGQGKRAAQRLQQRLNWHVPIHLESILQKLIVILLSDCKCKIQSASFCKSPHYALFCSEYHDLFFIFLPHFTTTSDERETRASRKNTIFDCF